jgi:hypothetical protein
MRASLLLRTVLLSLAGARERVGRGVAEVHGRTRPREG